MMNENEICWTIFSSIGTMAGVLVALFLPFIERINYRINENKRAIKRITFELVQLVQTLAIANACDSVTIIFNNGQRKFKYSDEIRKNTNFKLVDYDKSIEIILDNMVFLSNKKYLVMSEIIIKLKNIFAGSEWEPVKYLSVFEACITFIKNAGRCVSDRQIGLRDYSKQCFIMY